jgi:hypothetical protein
MRSRITARFRDTAITSAAIGAFAWASGSRLDLKGFWKIPVRASKLAVQAPRCERGFGSVFASPAGD